MCGGMTRQRQNLLIVCAALAFMAVAAVEVFAEVRAGRPGDHPGQLHGDARRFTIKVVDDDGVAPPTTAQRRGVEKGLARMQQWLGQHGGAVVTRATDVLLTDHEHCTDGGSDADTAGVTIDGRKICIFTADASRVMRETGAFVGQTAAHEAVHVLQGELGCAGVPSWFVEGMAEDLSWRATAPDYSEADLRGWAETEELGDKALGPSHHHLNYGTAMRAAIELEGGRPARLVAFCRAVGDGAPWPAAFAQAFHASPGRYADRF
jgi:hypothetical protein